MLLLGSVDTGNFEKPHSFIKCMSFQCILCSKKKKKITQEFLTIVRILKIIHLTSSSGFSANYKVFWLRNFIAKFY